MKSLQLRKAKKIGHVLIIRLSAMGDVAMTAPVVESLRASHPDLKITILTRPFLKPFFREIKDIDFLAFEPGGRHKGLAGLLRLAADIRATGADAVADLHDVLRTKVVRRLLYFTGMRISTVDKGRDERKELTRRTRKLFAPIVPMVERYRLTLYKLGLYFPVEYGMVRKTYPMPDRIAELAGEKKGAWIGVAPFAKHKGKIYPIPLADELIGLLSKKYKKVFIFGGGDYEQSFAEGMEIRHKGVVSVIGRVKLAAEMDVISNLDVIVTMDSSAMHMASLMGVPAVSVWGATHPFAGFYGWGQDPDDAVQLAMPCRPCSIYGNKPCIFGDYRCLADIAPEAIAAAVGRRLRNERLRIEMPAATVYEGGGEKKRGRPRKADAADAKGAARPMQLTMIFKRPVGRPKKEEAQVRRPVGRPRKEEQKRPVGRPRKETTEAKKPVGRPRKDSEPVKRPVGRPRKASGTENDTRRSSAEKAEPTRKKQND